MRVAITGMASWSALGRNLIEFERRLRAGESGVRPVTRMDVSHPFFRSRSAAVLCEESSLRPEVDQTMIADLALAVSRAALLDAGLPDPPMEPSEASRFGMTLGTSHGGNIAFMRLIREHLGPRRESLIRSLRSAVRRRCWGKWQAGLGCAGRR